MTSLARIMSSLRWRLSLAIGGVALLCVFVSVAGSYDFLRQGLTDRATADLRRTLVGVSGYIDNQRSDLRDFAVLIASDPTVARLTRGADHEGLVVHLIPFYANLNVDVLDVVNARGRVLVRMEDTLAYGDSVARRLSVRRALQGRMVTALETDLSRQQAAGGYALRAVAPLRVRSRIVGAVIVGRQLTSLYAARIGRAVANNVNLIAGGQRTGTTLTDSNGLPTTGVPEPPSVLARIAANRTSIARVTEGGTTVLSGVVPLRDAAGRPVGAVEVVASLGPLYMLTTQLALLLITLGAAVFVLGAGLALALGRRLTRRLQTLEAMAARVASRAGTGEPLDGLHEALDMGGTDEVASVARSVGSMVVALDERMGANERLYAAAKAEVEERLRDTEVQYLNVFEATSDGLVIFDLDGRTVDANPAACRMHGYSYEAFLSLPVEAWVHPTFRRGLVEYMRRVRRGGSVQTRSMDVRKDGTAFHIEVHGSPCMYRGRRHILTVIRDVTERVQAYQMLETRVEERTRELAALLEVSHNVTSTLELEPLLGLILEQLHTIVPYSSATVASFDGTRLDILDYRGPVPQELREQLRVALEQAARSDEFRRRTPVIVDDLLGSSPLAQEFQRVLGDTLEGRFFHARSWLAVPLVVNNRIIGMLSMAHAEPGYYTERHAGLVLAVAGQAAVAIENATLYGRAQALAAMEERARLARELHDSVTQALFSMTLYARTAEMALEGGDVGPDGKLAASVQQLRELTQGALAEMRALIFELRPGALAEEGLAAALQKQAAALSAREGIAVDVRAPDTRLPLDIASEEQLYRVAQEALHNVVKHAQARSIIIRLSCGGGDARTVVLEIRDDGVGFDPAAVPAGHLGLASMVERAQQIGAHLDVISAPGFGTTVRAAMAAQEHIPALA